MIEWSIATALLVAPPLASGALTSRLTADQVHELIDSKGARAAIAELFDSDGREEALADGIGTGEAEWLRVAQRLRPASDADSGETLCMAIQEALPKNASGVLALVHQGVFSIENACGMYGLGQIEDERPVSVLLGLVDLRVQAVASVRVRQVATEREACLRALRGLRNLLQVR